MPLTLKDIFNLRVELGEKGHMEKITLKECFNWLLYFKALLYKII